MKNQFMPKVVLMLMALLLPFAGNAEEEIAAVYEAFTGKVEGNQVRMRLQADLGSHIVQELSGGDFVLIVGEYGDYYAVKPPQGSKNYVFRTFVLDGVIEGYRVNVRLDPDLNSPVVTQLNTGDIADGVISPVNSKWLEIAPPESVVFYVSKDFIVKAGAPDLLQARESRKQDLQHQLNTAYLVGQAELRKSFEEINESKIESQFQAIVEEYSDFPEQVKLAEEGLELIRETYVQKKLIFLENQARLAKEHGDFNVPQTVAEEVLDWHEEGTVSSARGDTQVTDKMHVWEPVEEMVYLDWHREHTGKTSEDFYGAAHNSAIRLEGMLEAYSHPVKNKPGNYILRNESHLPVAFVYSTKVNLQDKIGQQVTLLATPRPNNNFAFPAYFILSTE